jgi:hypothetical protein
MSIARKKCVSVEEEDADSLFDSFDFHDFEFGQTNKTF